MSFEDVDEIVAGFHMPKNARLVPFNPTHILLMKLDPWQQSLLETWPDYLAHLKASTARGPAYLTAHRFLASAVSTQCPVLVRPGL